MNKKVTNVFLTSLCLAIIVGCGNDNKESQISTSLSSSDAAIDTSSNTQIITSSNEDKTTENTKIEVPEGMYLSELTGEPIDDSLKDQRPIAVMIDNEYDSLPHYGTTEADIVYELINSTSQDRITRLMCIIKDWGDIQKLGNIRSAQPTNIMLAAEYNAVLCHEDGPWFNEEYYQRFSSDHFSGVFSHVDTNNRLLYETFMLAGDLDKAFSESNITPTYSDTYYESGEKLCFTDYGTVVDLEGQVSIVTEVALPFYHNSSMLKYNEATEKYEYYEYGSIYQDAEHSETLAFDNVILQNTRIFKLDDNGYLEYGLYSSLDVCSYYLTKGKCIPIYWNSDKNNIIHYYTDVESTKELELNTGKTYIALVPSDTWDEVSLNN